MRFGIFGSVVLGGLLLAAAPRPLAAAPEVVVTIKPVHSLVAAVMGEGADPTLLVRGAASPHNYSLRPSDAKALNQAQLVFWVGEGLESFLIEPLAALSGKAKVVEVATLPGIGLLETREGGAWEAHVHDEDEEHDHDGHASEAEGHAHEKDDHDHAASHAEHDHDEHGHAEHAHEEHAHDEHGHEEHGHAEHAHDEHGHDEHGHDAHGHAGGKDMHLWLDPGNAKVIVEAAVKSLSDIDPANAERYRANGKAALARLDALDEELKTALAPVGEVPFVVFHDAYQYFEAHYGLTAVGSISVSEGRAPGAKRLREVRGKIAETGARCVFAEPQFEPALVATVIEGTSARTGVLDPVGAELDAGAAAYGQLLRGLAADLKKCLAPAS